MSPAFRAIRGAIFLGLNQFHIYPNRNAHNYSVIKWGFAIVQHNIRLCPS